MSIQITSKDAEKAFKTIEAGLAAFAPMVPGLGGEILAGIGAGAGLVADLIDLAVEPVQAITKIRDALPDFDAVRDELDAYARTGKP